MWTQIDDQFYVNQKNALMDRDEQDLYLAGLVYCNMRLTEGRIPGAMILMLGAWAKIPEANEAKCQAIASRLVAHCFWQIVDGGYGVHDFLDWNKTNEELEALRMARSQAGKVGGVHSGASRRSKRSKNEANAEANAKQNPKQMRSKNEPRTRTRTISDISSPPSPNGSHPEDEPESIKPLTPQREYFGAICKCIGWDPDTIGKDQAGEVAQAMGILKDRGHYTIEEIEQFKSLWQHDWRGQKGQWPTLKQLRAEIGKVRAPLNDPYAGAKIIT